MNSIVINKLERGLILRMAVENLINTDCLPALELGHTFDLAPAFKPEGRTLKVLLQEVLNSTGCHASLEKMAEYQPFTITYFAKGWLADVVCKDAEGDHIVVPSGFVAALKAATEKGIYPPALPEANKEGNEEDNEEALKKTLKAILMTAIKARGEAA